VQRVVDQKMLSGFGGTGGWAGWINGAAGLAIGLGTDLAAGLTGT
jgi:hypothetical protein